MYLRDRYESEITTAERIWRLGSKDSRSHDAVG